MEAHAQSHRGADHHSPLPAGGAALNNVAFSATLHCLTGCAIGEVTGMVIGTALGFSDLGTILLAIGLAFLFGYTLTSLPLLRAGLALSAVIPIALATDTFSIAVMEIVDNAIMLSVPGAMEAGPGNILFWGALSIALVIAGVVAFPVNRWLISRGKGHAVLHETGIHGGPPTRLVAFMAAAATIFGIAVLVGEALRGGDPGGGHAEQLSPSHEDAPATGHRQEAPDPVPGLAVSPNGLRSEFDQPVLTRRRESDLRPHHDLRFPIMDEGGQPVRDFEVEQGKWMCLA